MDLRLTRLTFSNLLRALADLLMPRVCAVCGRQLLPREKHLCLECEADLPLTHFGAMPHNPMADAFNALVEAPRYVRAAALFYYCGDYRQITQAIKYRRHFGLGREFGRRLGESLAIWQDVDVVCPVPLHWTRRYRRGYNQSEIIGREVASALGAAFEPRLLRRARRTRTQTSLNSEQRSANVAGAFSVRPRVLRALRERLGEGGPFNILLVDDVFTTGATLAACYSALRKALAPDVVGPEVLGSEVLGPDVLSADVLSVDVVGPDVLGSDVVGPDVIGSDVVGPNVIGSDVLVSDVRISVATLAYVDND